MTKLTKNGFVLVETLVVTVFIAILFVVVYQNTVSTMGEYEQISNFDDIDSLYTANLFKQNLIKYGNLDYINTTLTNNKYIDISDCNNKNIYSSSNYCTKLKRNIGLTNDDYIILTDYNIELFRNVVNNNDFFDSGKFSNFRNYISTVPNIDSDYANQKQKYDNEYRIFIIRTVVNYDNSNTIKYANLSVLFGNKKEISNIPFNTQILIHNNLITDKPNLSNSLVDKNGLYLSTDTNDGNPTYYFRGNVKNNYVVFAGYFWRIVRINEDGTIKLILANNIGNSNINTAKYTSSNAQSKVISWINNIDEYSDKISYGNFCLDEADSNFDFKCSEILNRDSGLLTKDEVIFAGGYENNPNDNYYLYDGNKILTMTTLNNNNWMINIDGSVQAISTDTYATIRPVINLKADVTAKGKGTTTNPYIIQ